MGVNFEGGGCVGGVADDDEVVVPAGGEGGWSVRRIFVGEVDGVVGVGDVEFAEESDDVEGVFVSFGGDFQGQEGFDVGGVDCEAVEVFEVDPGGVSGMNAEALALSQSGERS
ncbi:hypothetical protein [Arthrobacter sp. MI7-26]|uniref:hypothetical protein n=1 Tax=Arthrobacter sp. MI7-26 TaxID=2993653 RepID=UPI002248D2FD|nr:hypothetical protein [Arthrobacter sp. MI7-26]